MNQISTFLILTGDLMEFLLPSNGSGEVSLTICPCTVFEIATFSANRFIGSFLSNFSSSAGVY